MSFKACVSLLIFSLDDLSIGITSMLKSLPSIVFLLIFPFMTASDCLCIEELSVQFSHSVNPTLWNPMDCSMSGLPVHYQLGACLNSCPLSRWCHPSISSSVNPFSFHIQSFPTSGSFPMSQFFTRGGQSIGVSASARGALILGL